MDIPSYCIDILGKAHRKQNFSCGVQLLDNYLIKQASQDAKRYVTATYALTEINSVDIAGYYTLSSASINLQDLPEALSKKLPRYPTMPATFLGRLAVHENHQGEKLGELLLLDALKRSFALSKKVAYIAVVVDSKDDSSHEFYKHYGFSSFAECQNRFFLLMDTIKNLF